MHRDARPAIRSPAPINLEPAAPNRIGVTQAYAVCPSSQLLLEGHFLVENVLPPPVSAPVPFPLARKSHTILPWRANWQIRRG
jgi:hypothetical protein